LRDEIDAVDLIGARVGIESAQHFYQGVLSHLVFNLSSWYMDMIGFNRRR